MGFTPWVLERTARFAEKRRDRGGAGPQHTRQDAGGRAELGRTQVTAGSEERQPQVQLMASQRRAGSTPIMVAAVNKVAAAQGRALPPSRPQSA